MTDIKPCPFCGETNVTIEKTDRNEVTLKCQSHSCGLIWRQKVIHQSTDWLAGRMAENWNSRPIEDALRSELIAARAEIERMRDANTENFITEGGRRVVAERLRQVTEEGWTPQHDAQHVKFQLSMAAIAYLLPSNSDHVQRFWPWDWKYWKPKSTIQNLIRAGALVIAEIDRLLPQPPKEGGEG